MEIERKTIEVFWIVASTVGLVSALYGAMDVYKDFHAARVNRVGGISYLFARSNLRAQTFRTSKLFLLLTVGIISFTIPPATPWRSLTMLLLLLVVTVFTALDSVFDRVAKRSIMIKLARGESRRFYDTGELPLLKD